MQKDLNITKELRNELINKNIQKQVHKQNSFEIHHSLLQKLTTHLENTNIQKTIKLYSQNIQLIEQSQC